MVLRSVLIRAHCAQVEGVQQGLGSMGDVAEGGAEAQAKPPGQPRATVAQTLTFARDPMHSFGR